LASAEFGMVSFDEANNFYFFNRRRWNRAPGNVSQATVTSTNMLEQLQIRSDTDGVINHVQIGWAPYQIGEYQQVYKLGNVKGVHSGSVIRFTAHLDFPCTAIDYGFPSNDGDGRLHPLPAGPVTTSGYRASFDPNGNGNGDPPDEAHIGVWVDYVDQQTVRVTVQNTLTRPIYLVSGSDQAASSKGNPFVYIFGRPVLLPEPDQSTGDDADNSTTIDVQDDTSIAKYGERVYSAQQNDWLQSQDSATAVANNLLAQLKDPHPLIENVEIKGHPGLQLGDRITIQDTTGTQLNTSSPNIGTVVVGINETWNMGSGQTDAGYKQALTVRLMDMTLPLQ
ncbi:MAG: hypothetical protein J2P17_19945, partial [Mycobacterium sp.]|nr:hypothetical protein [Mycobacterium sp.]